MKNANDNSLIKLSENSDFFDGTAPATTALWKEEIETNIAATVDIYTDGCCLFNPGPGGHCAVFVSEGHVVYGTKGGASDTTNNRMELQAVIKALNAFQKPVAGRIIIHTDSTYVSEGITKRIQKWKANNWRTSGRDPVKNRDLWEELDALCAKLGDAVQWSWLRGHNGHRWNEMADKIAKSAAHAFLTDQVA